MSREGAIVFRTALGWSAVVLAGEGIGRVLLPRSSKRAVLRELGPAKDITSDGTRPRGKGAKHIVRTFQRFFSGLTASTGIPLDLRKYTAFQRSVWKAAQQIPYGETRSYGWIAKRIGKPNAARAVGQAMGANPVPILVP